MNNSICIFLHIRSVVSGSSGHTRNVSPLQLWDIDRYVSWLCVDDYYSKEAMHILQEQLSLNSQVKLLIYPFHTNILISFSIYQTSEQYFSRALIGQLGGDQPSTIHLRAAKKNKIAFVGTFIFTNKGALWTASYSTCVAYTKTIIHLSVGKSGGY